MFGTEIQRQARAVAERIVRPIAALGVSPNVVSLVGLLLTGAAALVVALGPLRWAGVCVLLASVFDMFDGAVARAQQATSTFGAFLDSVLDRYAEGLLFLGVIIHALRAETHTIQLWTITLAYVAAILSLVVSYTRARAEGLGMECKVGLMERPERVIVLGVGLVIGGQAWLLWVMVVMVIGTGITGAQRIFHVWRNAPPPARSVTRPATQARNRETTAPRQAP